MNKEFQVILEAAQKATKELNEYMLKMLVAAPASLDPDNVSEADKAGFTDIVGAIAMYGLYEMQKDITEKHIFMLIKSKMK